MRLSPRQKGVKHAEPHQTNIRSLASPNDWWLVCSNRFRRYLRLTVIDLHKDVDANLYMQPYSYAITTVSLIVMVHHRMRCLRYGESRFAVMVSPG
jgi:hypothetical protein